MRRSTKILNSTVDDLLFDEPAELSKVYRYLCNHMDSSTCITGIKRRVSFQAIKELLEVPQTKGRAVVPSSRRKARSVLARMHSIGLIIDKGDCVFYMQHETDSMRKAQGKPKAGTMLASNSNGLGGNLAQAKPKVGPHLSTTTTTTNFFQMFSEWEPSQGFDQDALRAGYQIAGKHEALYNSAMIDVKYAYMGKEELIATKRNQIGWQAEVIRSMKYLLRQHLSDLAKLKGDGANAKPSSAKPAKGGKSSSVKQFISRVPNDDGDLDRYFEKYKGMGAPKAKQRRDYSYQSWRADLVRWRADELRKNLQEESA